jgi:phage gp29-like protein
VSGVEIDLTQRTIHNDPRELWYLAFPSKLTPKQVIQILRSALGGDLWQQWQLLSLMLDSWPMLRKCCHELRQAVATTRFIVRPFAVAGEEPSDLAKEKADIVQRGIAGMCPDPFEEEEGFSGAIYDFGDAVINGMTVAEIMWQQNSAREILPRAIAWAHPRHYTFGNDGRLALFDDTYNRLTYRLALSPGTSKASLQNKFIVAKFKSRSGSSLGQGLMRPLAYDWSAVMFARDWMLTSAKKFGSPFVDATYKIGTPDVEIQRMNAFLAGALASGYALHPDGSVLNVNKAEATGENAQSEIMRTADEHCMELLLGQTATTRGTAGKLGGEQEHGKVKREIIEWIAKWIGEILTNQFARTIIRLNYGEESELPNIEPDFTEALDPIAQAQRDQILLSSNVPMLAEDFYKLNGLTMPAEDDKVIVGGRLGVLGGTEQILGEQPAPVDPNNPNNPNNEPDADDDQGLRAALKKMPQQELAQLRQLVIAAHEAPHLNGEWESVKVKVKEVKARFARG